MDLKGPRRTQDNLWIPGLVLKKIYFGVGLNVQVQFPISIVFKAVHTLNVILAEGTIFSDFVLINIGLINIA